MTSLRKIMANRTNARKSTSPKTPGGKARSSRNALRHGCEQPALWGAGLTPEIEALARTMAGKGSNSERFGLACRIAAAQFDLARVRRAKRDLQAAANFGCMSHHHGIVATIPDWNLLLPISQIERYEQRALARRRRAIRDFYTFRSDEEAAKNFYGTNPTGENAMISKEWDDGRVEPGT